MDEEDYIPLPEGTLVRVLESALNEDAKWSGHNASIVTYHGYLYLIEEWNENNETYESKSLATGERGVTWFPYEIEAAEGNDG